jgi:hypothetical protein
MHCMNSISHTHKHLKHDNFNFIHQEDNAQTHHFIVGFILRKLHCDNDGKKQTVEKA